ncbi:hypothetical protein quinque_015753 [Culex quinquefasciatus]
MRVAGANVNTFSRRKGPRSFCHHPASGVSCGGDSDFSLQNFNSLRKRNSGKHLPDAFSVNRLRKQPNHASEAVLPPVLPRKTETKKKEKVIEDKTFGLKNKKGAKQQKFISQVEKQVKSGGRHNLAANPECQEGREGKEAGKENGASWPPCSSRFRRKRWKRASIRKSILCAFFKRGTCTKGVTSVSSPTI